MKLISKTSVILTFTQRFTLTETFIYLQVQDICQMYPPRCQHTSDCTSTDKSYEKVEESFRGIATKYGRIIAIYGIGNIWSG